MRTSTSKMALIALAGAVFALPAFAADNMAPSAAPTSPATMSPTNPAPMPSAQMNRDKAAMPSAQSDAQPSMQKDNAVAAAPGLGDAADVGHHRASRIIGTDVVNDKDQTIGKIDDIMIGADNKATMAVISVGGFLGIGSKLVAVPFDQLQQAANDKKSLTLPNASKAQLESMPAFKYSRGA